MQDSNPLVRHGEPIEWRSEPYLYVDEDYFRLSQLNISRNTGPPLPRMLSYLSVRWRTAFNPNAPPYVREEDDLIDLS